MQQKAGRKLLGFLIMLALVFGLMPGMALAEHTHDSITFTAWDSNTGLPGTEGNYYLTQDVTIGSTWGVPTDITNLCLNGHGIRYTGTNNVNGTVINIGNGRTLNLYDCNQDTTHRFTVDEKHLAQLNEENGILTINGGYITGGNVAKRDIYNDNNHAGAGVTVNGVFNMNGGTIIGNYHNGDGGGVLVRNENGAAFTMNGGTIRNNYATGNGGGVQTNRSFVMNGGIITENCCNNAGGGVLIQWLSTANLVMNGGTIAHNYNVGIFQNNSTALTIGGDAVIEDNLKKDGTATTDIRLTSSTGKIVLTGLRNNAKPIYITDITGVFTSSSNTAYNDVTRFASTYPAYRVGKNTNDQLSFVLPYSVTYNGNGATGGNPPTDDTEYVMGVNTTVNVLSKGTLVKEGYSFAGWKIGNESIIYANSADKITGAVGTFTISGNTTLTAQWAPIIVTATGATLTYDYSTGSVSVSATPAAGYELTGYQWYSCDSDGNNRSLINNATGSSYIIPTGKDSGQYYYFCVVTAKPTGNSQTTTATSSIATVTILPIPENTPTNALSKLNISYPNETISAIDGYEVSSTNDENGTPVTDISTILDNTSPTVYVRKSATDNNHAPSDWVAVTLATRPEAPPGLTTTSATNGSVQDGKIKGTSSTMEYRSPNGNWQDADDTETAVRPGEYVVRVKATDSAPHGRETMVEVGNSVVLLTENNKPIISLPDNHTAPVIGDTLTASTSASPVTYQWYVGGTAVPGAIDATYIVQTEDYGKAIRVEAIQSTGYDGRNLPTPIRMQSEDTSLVEKNDYKYISGDGSTWSKSSCLPLPFEVKNSVNDSETFDKFMGIQVDGKDVADGNYDTFRGSVIIRMKSPYLETLSIGEHKLTAEFDDGTAEAKFTILAPIVVNLPQTGDGSSLPLFALMGLLSIAGLGLMMKKRT